MCVRLALDSCSEGFWGSHKTPTFVGKGPRRERVGKLLGSSLCLVTVSCPPNDRCFILSFCLKKVSAKGTRPSLFFYFLTKLFNDSRHAI